MRRTILAVALLLAGCGAQQRLKPAPGKALPLKPATAPSQPAVSELLTVPATIRPSRSDELLTRSQPRNDDRFDLPPQ